MTYKKNMKKVGKAIGKAGKWAYKNPKTVAGLAKSVGYLMSVINPELKYADKYLTETTSTTGHVDSINLIAQGTEAYQRTGNSIKAHSIWLRAGFRINQTVPTACMCRTMLVKDLTPNGSTPALSDIVESTSNILSPIKKSSAQRFHIYFDKVFQLDQYNGIKMFKKYIPLDCHIRYKGNGSTISDVESNGFFLVHWSDLSSNLPTQIWASRLNFYDN